MIQWLRKKGKNSVQGAKESRDVQQAPVEKKMTE